MTQNFDPESINKRIDPFEIVGGMKAAGIGWWAGACPKCGGRDRFVIHQARDGYKWFCRHCGDGKYNDMISLAQIVWNCDFVSVCERVDGQRMPEVTYTTPAPPPEKTMPDDLQPRWHEVVKITTDLLYTEAGTKAREWLRARGLTDYTIAAWNLGYHPGGAGFERGIYIPCFEHGYLNYVKVRRPAGEPKYKKLPGMKDHGNDLVGLFGADLLRTDSTGTVLFCEGEFDAMLLQQQAGDLIDVCTLGACGDKFNFKRWGGLLADKRKIYVCFDNDAPGETAGAKFAEAIGGEQILLPDKKDITEFHLAGGDLRAWIQFILDI